MLEQLARRRDVPEGPLLYVGNLGWHPNVAGLDWFFAHVWPKLSGQKLRIAGSGLKTNELGHPIVPPAWQHENVEVLGFVSDLEPLYRSSSVVVAPILGGSGVRIKLLEAMRAGLPLVTTAEAVAGTQAVPGRDLLAEDEPGAFAAAVGGLLESRERRVALRDAGYGYLEAHHGPEAARIRMRQALGLGD